MQQPEISTRCSSCGAAVREPGMFCPECGKPLTIGVLNRVTELADRPEGYRPDGAASSVNLVSLPDVVGELLGTGPKSKKVDAEVTKKVEAERRAEAERRGNNPNLRGGESSRSPSLPKIKPDDFHKADGNQSRRERTGRMLENIHRDVAATRESV